MLLETTRTRDNYNTNQLTPIHPPTPNIPINKTLIPITTPATTLSPAPINPACPPSPWEFFPRKTQSNVAARLSVRTKASANKILLTDHETTNSSPSCCSARLIIENRLLTVEAVTAEAGVRAESCTTAEGGSEERGRGVLIAGASDNLRPAHPRIPAFPRRGGIVKEAEEFFFAEGVVEAFVG
jgi:hypothetical protein